MQLFLLNEDGSDIRQITTEPGTHWSPYPAPDGIHAVYVKLLPPRNFEIFLINLKTGEEKRLTYNDAFDGFPSISPDGRLMAVSSSRGAAAGQRTMSLYPGGYFVAGDRPSLGRARRMSLRGRRNGRPH